jgi:hypothetical protein
LHSFLCRNSGQLTTMQHPQNNAAQPPRDDQAAPQLLPYEPPKVQSVKLSDDAAESLT